MTELKKTWVKRIAIGGTLGLAAGFLGVRILFMPAFLMGASFSEFLLYIGQRSIPGRPGSLLACVLWFLFGAEIAVATLPFDDRGWMLAVKSLAHFAAMEATMIAWAWLRFGWQGVPFLALPLAALYALVWGIRWVFWWFELRAIRKKLGLK